MDNESAGTRFETYVSRLAITAAMVREVLRNAGDWLARR